MQMHNPPHPGEFIEGVYLEPCALSIRQVAGKSRVSPDMALRLSRHHDLWQARQRLDLSGLTLMELTPA
jgi:plasmid maintenance system antidote protein VapI